VLAVESREPAAAEIEGALLTGRLYGVDEGTADGYYFERQVLLRNNGLVELELLASSRWKALTEGDQ
jgi:hypothetical protein